MLVAQVEAKAQLVEDLQRELEPLARNKLIVVDGEVGQVSRLRQLIDQATTHIEALKQVTDTKSVIENLRLLEEAVTAVEWELTDNLKETITRKTELQNKVVSTYQNDFKEWPNIVRDLREALNNAIKVRGPVRLEEIEFKSIESQVNGIQRAFEEGEYSGLRDRLAQLNQSPVKSAGYLEKIREKTKQAAVFMRQADLMLLQAPLDDRRLFHYSVLLRTPSEPGTHGINIQEPCAVVKQDRDEMFGLIDKITYAVDRGVSRSFEKRKAKTEATTSNNGGPTVNEGTATPPVEPAAAETTGGPPNEADPLRRVELNIPEGSPFGQLGESLNDMVKDVGDFMYRLFMSDQMQNYLYESPCSLTITTNDLVLPWELMSYRDKLNPDEPKFLCLERPVARMPMGRYFPRQHRPLRGDRALNFLLIYADPKNNLPAAKREVEAIHEALKKRWGDHVEIKVLSQAEASGRAMNEALRNDTFAVIHFAGHAFFDGKDADLSGLLLHEEEHFLAQKIRRLLEGRPLVFLNACESASIANEEQPQRVEAYLQEPAEGLASAFIYGGALGCVGSLWPIYDKPAADFAIHFYNNLLSGYMVGDAVRLARRKIKEDYKDEITWAAYVLYGDPTLHL
jgi:hypothetical protein